MEPAGADEAGARSHASVGPADLDELLQREDLAVIVTDLGGIVTHWNARAERLYGWPAAEVLGHPITAFTVGPEDETVAENIMEAVRTTGRWEGAFWVRRRDGDRFLAEVREAMVSDAGGTPIGLVGVSVEVPPGDTP